MPLKNLNTNIIFNYTKGKGKAIPVTDTEGP
jgi:hypothetical protein